MRKEKESRKELGHTMKKTMGKKNFKNNGFLLILRLDNLARLSSSGFGSVVYFFVSHFDFSFRVTSWIRVYRGDPGN